MKRKIINSIMVLLLITSGLSAGAGQVAAVHDCSAVDALVLGFSFGTINQDKCTNNHVDFAVEEVRDAETAQDELDLFQAAISQKAQTDNYNVLFDNYVKDTKSVAWMKAEAAIARVYKSGGTKAEAKIEAKSAIEDYYSNKTLRLIESWNTSVLGMYYLKNRSRQEDLTVTSNDENVYLIAQFNPSVNKKVDLDDRWVSSIGTTSVTLPNGTTVNSRSLTVNLRDTGDSDNDRYYTTDALSGKYVDAEMHNSYEDGFYNITGIMVIKPNDNYENTTVLNLTAYSAAYNKIDAYQTELQSESDTFVDGVWDDLQTEGNNVTVDDILSRTTLMFEYGTKSQAGNGSYYDVIGALATMGLDSPNLSKTGQMTISYKGAEYDGLLFARNAPNNQWVVGETYNPANITGPVFFATLDGDMMDLDDNFTVISATDKNGNDQTTVSTTQYNYRSSNTTDLYSKYNEILGFTEELQERSESVGGGGGSTSSSGSLDWLTDSYLGIPVWGWIITGFGVIALVNRS